MSRLDEIEQRLNNRTSKSPWGLYDKVNNHCMVTQEERGPNGEFQYVADCWHEGDMQLIAHAPQDIRWLIDEIKRLR